LRSGFDYLTFLYTYTYAANAQTRILGDKTDILMSFGAGSFMFGNICGIWGAF